MDLRRTPLVPGWLRPYLHERKETHFDVYSPRGAPKVGERGYLPDPGPVRWSGRAAKDIADAAIEMARDLLKDPEGAYLLMPDYENPDSWDLDHPDNKELEVADMLGIPYQLPDGSLLSKEDRATMASDAVEAAKLTDPMMSPEVTTKQPKSKDPDEFDAAKYRDPEGNSPPWLAAAAFQDALTGQGGYGGKTPKLRLVAVSKQEACAFIKRHHSALPNCNTRGIMYAIGAVRGQRLVAVATAGTPTGRWKNPHAVLELTRVASDGSTSNAASMLVGRLLDLTVGSARVKGAPARFITYQLVSERGVSYKALSGKGLRPVAYMRGKKRGGSQDRRGTPGDDALASVDKIRWEAGPGAGPADPSVLKMLGAKEPPAPSKRRKKAWRRQERERDTWLDARERKKAERRRGRGKLTAKDVMGKVFGKNWIDQVLTRGESLSRTPLLILVESPVVAAPPGPGISRPELDQLEGQLRVQLRDAGFDVKFTDHFFQRLGHERNKPPVRIEEVAKLFRAILGRKKLRGRLQAGGEGYKAVLYDMATDLNAPFHLTRDRRAGTWVLIPRTIMRTKRFKTRDKVHSVKSEGVGADMDVVLLEGVSS